MIDPQAATDAEVSAWLAEHCMGWHLENKVWCYKNEHGQYFNTNWHPTDDYNQLVMCEAKVRDRWNLTCTQLGEGDLCLLAAEQFDVAPRYRRWIEISFEFGELSNRARLVVKTLQWEVDHDKG